MKIQEKVTKIINKLIEIREEGGLYKLYKQLEGQIWKTTLYDYTNGKHSPSIDKIDLLYSILFHKDN